MDQIAPVLHALDDDEEERDRPCNAYRFASSENAKGIIGESVWLAVEHISPKAADDFPHL